MKTWKLSLHVYASVLLSSRDTTPKAYYNKHMNDWLEATDTPTTEEDKTPRNNKGQFTSEDTDLTRKQNVFVREMIDNPKQSATEAAAKAYNTKNRNVAGVVAHELLRNPKIIMALGEHNELFESAIVGTVREWGRSDSARKREIALDAAKFGHDKIHGKATTRVEQTTNVVQIAINLTGDGEQPPREMLDLTNDTTVL